MMPCANDPAAVAITAQLLKVDRGRYLNYSQFESNEYQKCRFAYPHILHLALAGDAVKKDNTETRVTLRIKTRKNNIMMSVCFHISSDHCALSKHCHMIFFLIHQI